MSNISGKNLICNVKLWGEAVGILVHDTKDKIFFQYDDKFLEKTLEISPIKLRLSKRVYESTYDTDFHSIPSVFADSMPDKYGTFIIEKHFMDIFKIPPHKISPLQKLLYIGKRASGALEYEPADNTHTMAMQTMEISELVAQAKKVISGDLDSVLTDMFKESSSPIGGARAKAVVAWNPETNDIVSANAELSDGYEHWIIKFDGVTDDMRRKYDTLLEHIYLEMARDIGMQVVKSQIIQYGGLNHIAIKRFDRAVNNDKPYHLLTLAAMTGVDFRNRDSISYEQFFRTIQLVSTDRTQITEAYSRLVFNVLSGNQDDHAKNHSFIMDRNGSWKLSPAYDLTPSFGGGHQMVINGKTKSIDIQDLLDIAAVFDIKKPQNIIDGQLEVLLTFEARAKEFGVAQGIIEDVLRGFKN